MDKRFPQVSVIIPLYNSENYFAEALASVLVQSFSDFDIIVVDDGSKTNACEATVFQARERSAHHIRYIRQDNQGPAAARNRGLAESASEFVAFLDSDDMYDPCKLSLQVKLIRDLPQDYAFVTGGFQEFLGAGAWKLRTVLPAVLDGNLYQTLLRGKALIPRTPGTHLFRRHALQAVGGFDRALRFGEDKDLLIRLTRRFRAKTHREVVCRRRIHAGSLSATLNPDIVGENVSHLIKKLQESNPQLSKRVANRMQRTALMSCGMRSLTGEKDYDRFVALVKEAVQRAGLSLSWKAWACMTLAYSGIIGRRLAGFYKSWSQ